MSVNESTPLIPSSGAFENPPSSFSGSSEQNITHPMSFFLAIVFGIAINLPLLVSDFVLLFILRDNEVVFIAWEVIVCVYKSIMLIMSICIFIHLTKRSEPNGHSKKLTANEYILIFSSAGSVALLTFGIIAGIQLRTVRGNLVLADCLIDIVAIYVQTVLIIHSERKKPRNEINTCCATEHLILLLAICNFVFWAIDSFIDFRYKKDLHIENKYFGEATWEKIRDILYPILIFYRFHASIDLYGFFCKFRHR